MNETKKDVRIIRPSIGLDAEKPLRVGAYCRVSTGSDEQADSFIAQVRYYTDFIRHSDNMVLVDIYADEGITGTSASKRPEFQRMLKDSQKGKLDRIYVKSVSRFARNALDCIENIRFLKANGTAVLFENDNIDTEKMNSEMILYIKSAFAQSEALAGSQRVTTAIRMRMARGEFIAASVPFGYRLQDGILVPCEEEAQIVRQIYQWFRSGAGIGTIVKQLNDVNAGNLRWTLNHVKYILQNERYIGDSLFQKQYTPYILPLKKQPNHGEVDKYYVKNTHKAILDESLYQAVQGILSQNRIAHQRSKAPTNALFSGVLYCADCGRSYRLRKADADNPTWVCSRNGVAGQRCGTHPVSEVRIKRTFLSMLNCLQQHKELLIHQTVLRLEAIKRQCASGKSELFDIDREIAELSNKNELYVRLKSKGVIDDVSYAEQTGALQNRIYILRTRRRKLLCEDDDLQTIENLKSFEALLDSFPQICLEFPLPVFQDIIRRIAVKPESLMFEFHCGLKLEEPLWK